MTPPYTTAQLIRMQRLDTMLEAIGDFWASTGRERVRCRRFARLAISDFRQWHLIPERRAFEAAVARNKMGETNYV